MMYWNPILLDQKHIIKLSIYNHTCTEVLHNKYVESECILFLSPLSWILFGK
jgi:hypothetical protein